MTTLPDPPDSNKRWFTDSSVKGPAVITAFVGGPWRYEGGPDSLEISLDQLVGSAFYVPEGRVVLKILPDGASEKDIDGFISGFQWENRAPKS